MEFITYPSDTVSAGQPVTLTFGLETEEKGYFDFRILDSRGRTIPIGGNKFGIRTEHMDAGEHFDLTIAFPEPGNYEVQFRTTPKGARTSPDFAFLAALTVVDPILRVALVPAGATDSGQADLWTFIGEVADSLRFEPYIDYVGTTAPAGVFARGYGSLTYKSLHEATTDFVTQSSLGSVFSGSAWSSGPLTAAAEDLSYVSGENRDLAKPFPYHPDVESDYPLRSVPFVELIFTYWMEEAMLFQTLNHIVARFQNRRSLDSRDILARLSVNPLLPLRGIIYGLAEAERERLSVRRRAAEYEYEYGLQLIGRAIPPAETLVERRTQFLGAFHNLLHATYLYYKERDDKTIDADPFPLLSSLQELHLVLARGAHNQFADLPLTARIETMDVQWMLAQPEMREFLGGPTMIPYEEPWMDRVDTMKTMQGWSEVSVTHFYDLAFHGEQLLLSVRHGRWNESSRTRDDAENWAMHWRNSIQRYAHAYRVVTGVDLNEKADATMPSRLLLRHLAQKTANP